TWERLAVGGRVVDEVAGPDVGLDPRRTLRAAIAAGPRLGPEFPGLPPPDRPPQAQLVPEPTDPLEIHRPAAAEEHRVDAAVAVARMPPGQPLDLGDQRRFISSAGPAIPQVRAGPAQGPAGPPLPGPVVPGHGV